MTAGWGGRLSVKRTCPAPGCEVPINRSLFSCKSHWFALSKPVREAIWATVGQGSLEPDRRAAIEAALEEWHA